MLHHLNQTLRNNCMTLAQQLELAIQRKQFPFEEAENRKSTQNA
jgi:hypothetical protein